MEALPTPELLDFLQQTADCCRTNAAYAHVPDFARRRLSDAVQDIEFFVERQQYQRATQEAVHAIEINSSVVCFLRGLADAMATLRAELDEN